MKGGSSVKVTTSLIVAILLVLFSSTAVAGQAVDLDENQQEQINRFLSNFSEVLVQPFAREGISDEELIRFGILHTWWNNRKLITREQGIERLPTEAVERAVKKYFGRSLSFHQSSSPGASYRFDYYEGFYQRSPSFLPDFLGHKFAISVYFTQVTVFEDEGNGEYTVYGNIYMLEPQTVGPPNLYIPLVKWDARIKEAVRFVNPIKAIVRQIETDDSSRYILVEYCYLVTEGKE